jgi:molecular chaperone GrpE
MVDPEPAPEEGSAAPPAAAPAAPAASPPTPPAEDWAVRYKYLLAEFDNYRKRVDRERESLRRESRALLLRQLLPLADALHGAESALTKLPPDHPVRRGLELLISEWRRLFAAERVEEVARPGEPFRPDEEEAIGEARADDEHPEGTVAEVVLQGYRSPAGLLRAAKVLVARAPRPPTDRAKSGTEVATVAPRASED